MSAPVPPERSEAETLALRLAPLLDTTRVRVPAVNPDTVTIHGAHEARVAYTLGARSLIVETFGRAVRPVGM